MVAIFFAFASRQSKRIAFSTYVCIWRQLTNEEQNADQENGKLRNNEERNRVKRMEESLTKSWFLNQNEKKTFREPNNCFLLYFCSLLLDVIVRNAFQIQICISILHHHIEHFFYSSFASFFFQLSLLFNFCFVRWLNAYLYIFVCVHCASVGLFASQRGESKKSKGYFSILEPKTRAMNKINGFFQFFHFGIFHAPKIDRRKIHNRKKKMFFSCCFIYEKRNMGLSD